MRRNQSRIIFQTERLFVRQYTIKDADNFFSLAGDPLVMQYIRDVSTREESDRFLHENIHSYKARPLEGRWAVHDKQSGEFVGSFAIIPLPSKPGEIQLGYSLLPAHWGKGYATELAIAGLDFFRKNFKVPVIYAVTEKPNIASQKVLLKAGFSAAGSFIEKTKELLLFTFEREFE
jgi:ribosomal-protein-alanine N-acetyltransferase